MKFKNTLCGKLSTVGFGSMQCTDEQIIQGALNSGVNFFVTAETYGDENQRSLGNVLGENKKNTFIATKVGINFMGQNAEEQFTQSREQIRESVQKCIGLLGKKPLDMVSLHRLDDIHYVLNSNAEYVPVWEIALEELINLQKEGLISHIGLSEPTARQLERAISITKNNETEITAIESAYSIVTRRIETNNIKNICDREQILIIAYTTVVRGLMDARLQQITEQDFILPHGEFREKVFNILGMKGDFVRDIDMFSDNNIKNNIKHMLRFQTIAINNNVTPAQLALAWVQHKGAIPIPGTTNVKHLEENNYSAELVDRLHSKGVFSELDILFPAGTFHGDPNPICLSGALDINSKELNGESDHYQYSALTFGKRK